MAERDLDDRVLDQIIARIGRRDYPAWAAQLAGAGNCAHPVRLQGRITTLDTTTGEQQLAFTTTTQPDHVLLKACGSRRATRCPACAAVYRSDARTLILAGLLGGKGIDPAVAAHPLVFVTLTAPAFGTTHTPAGTDHHPCRPAPTNSTSTSRCRHRRPRHCPQHHDPDDTVIGQPLCPDCYDTTGAVIWNARATELWRRTTIAIRRRLAHTAGLTIRHLNQQQSLAFIKVAEYQQRGLVHFHALLRVDPHPGHHPLPAHTLTEAVTTTLPRVTAANPHQPDRPIRWGTQNAVLALPAPERATIALYLAKYATKSVDTGGALDHRLRHGNLTNYPLPHHLRTLAETAWTLGGQPHLTHLNLRLWAHTLGYRGHWLTKSQTWSTTLTQLRTDRHHYQLNRHGHPTPTPHDPIQRTGEWTYHGTGHTNDGDAWLATNAHHNRQQNRRTAWQERT